MLNWPQKKQEKGGNNHGFGKANAGATPACSGSEVFGVDYLPFPLFIARTYSNSALPCFYCYCSWLDGFRNSSANLAKQAVALKAYYGAK